ncbi:MULTISPECIES: hypothetical protein [unclassified Shewanella]|uniref:hypothetical protein n=1 Tax=unclassified Shewanella TaxID=196818 RepID=UPI000C854DB9|nr:MULTISPECIES: hypothetical protein [unclassified Shewanella]MDO6617903.1 hypothetical protein [Shewanella sp. 6_MG-2023]MDO6639972.1 hypothetical protein [Shewanella sp. 5_MG-2023]MDO6678317.1 hypothetical protein [Shewanella sp. 4_MG-2023]MDO6775558.1 hypothetical protein [Shewanella sp. 3_MG-2023]PMG28160.1 hypothetical protein BCU94_03935 [Shewanella sp. 10N.286.52.C2]
MSNIFKILHAVGLIFVAVGAGLYLFTEVASQVSGMLVVACLIGLGFVIMAPYPVALVFSWAQKQAVNSTDDEQDK